MEYSDNLISSPENFAKMAKEYASRLEREKVYHDDSSKTGEILIAESSGFLKLLCQLYPYVRRNMKTPKYRTFFLKLEEDCKDDLISVQNRFPIIAKKEAYLKTQKLKNLNSCIRYAISCEAELVKILIKLIEFSDSEFVVNLCNKHLDIILSLLTY